MTFSRGLGRIGSTRFVRYRPSFASTEAMRMAQPVGVIFMITRRGWVQGCAALLLAVNKLNGQHGSILALTLPMNVGKYTLALVVSC